MRIHLAVVALAIMLVAGAACSDDQPGSVEDAGEDAEAVDAPDASEEPDAEPEPDADATEAGLDADGSASRCGEGDNTADCDYDGLLDCEEVQLGTAVCHHDTDDDGLGDMQEFLAGTDPNEPDSDGDGVEDGEEVDLGLDPTKYSTWDDGICDCDRWVVRACEDSQPAAHGIYVSNSVSIPGDSEPQRNIGDWRIGLPDEFSNYTELVVDGLSVSDDVIDNRKAAAVYHDPATEVAGFVLSLTPDASATSPHAVLDEVDGALDAQGTVTEHYVGGEHMNYAWNRAATNRYWLDTGAQTSTELRDALLLGMAPFGQNEVSGLPSATGADHNGFRVFVSVVYRDRQTKDQALVLVAIAPTDAFENSEQVQFHTRDLTDTSSIARVVDINRERCNLFLPRQPRQTDFYWVVDQAGTMADDQQRLRALADEFFDELADTALDSRVGITSMASDRHGQLSPSVAWLTDSASFEHELDVIANTTGNEESWGLQAAKEGIGYMKGLLPNSPPQDERIRPDAELVTIFVSDNEAQTFDNTPLSTSTGEDRLQEFIGFFTQHTVAFAFVGDGQNCGEADGASYRRVAQQTGGSAGSLCSADLSQVTQEMIYNVASSTVGYRLVHEPISSSLKVYVDGREIPRSRQNGFDYFAQTNSLAFFGDARPGFDDSGRPHVISVTYRAWAENPRH